MPRGLRARSFLTAQRPGFCSAEAHTPHILLKSNLQPDITFVGSTLVLPASPQAEGAQGLQVLGAALSPSQAPLPTWQQGSRRRPRQHGSHMGIAKQDTVCPCFPTRIHTVIPQILSHPPGTLSRAGSASFQGCPMLLFHGASIFHRLAVDGCTTQLATLISPHHT